MKCKLILDGGDKSNRYSDGSIESELLAFFQSYPSANSISQFNQERNEWAVHYHLAPERHNLLSWINFDSSARVLEIGAGCGALTGLLCQRAREVVAVELTARRAEILAHRHHERGNLTIIAGNIHDIAPDESFDYVTCIGVLEYAGRFTDSGNPYLDFMLTLRQRLRPGGTLILAIENRYGIKYWAGAPEDHTGRPYDSIEGYPLTREIRTFGKPELEKLLHDSGFAQQNYYYPLPDYKLPLEIFSDTYLPNESHHIRPGIFPSPHELCSSNYNFDESSAMQGLIMQRMFPFFANSFLVLANTPI